MTNMKLFTAKYMAIIFLITGVLVGLWVLICGDYITAGDYTQPDPNKAKDIHPFFTGLVVPLLTLGSTLLIYENLRNTTKQNFSINFFKLIEMQHKIRDNISDEVWELSDIKTPSKGTDFFDDLAHRICIDYNTLPFTLSPIVSIQPYNLLTFETLFRPHQEHLSMNVSVVNAKSHKTKLRAIYDYYFHIYQSSIGHYFRNLYYLVKYVDDSNFRADFKKYHVCMLRAQLSNYELVLLAYNGLHDYGEKFYRLIEEYELLKSLNDESRVPDGYVKRIIEINILRNEYPHLKRLYEEQKLKKSKSDL